VFFFGGSNSEPSPPRWKGSFGWSSSSTHRLSCFSVRESEPFSFSCRRSFPLHAARGSSLFPKRFSPVSLCHRKARCGLFVRYGGVSVPPFFVGKPPVVSSVPLNLADFIFSLGGKVSESFRISAITQFAINPLRTLYSTLRDDSRWISFSCRPVGCESPRNFSSVTSVRYFPRGDLPSFGGFDFFFEQIGQFAGFSRGGPLSLAMLGSKFWTVLSFLD